jgi:hypothetical protein
MTYGARPYLSFSASLFVASFVLNYYLVNFPEQQPFFRKLKRRYIVHLYKKGNTQLCNVCMAYRKKK